MADMQMTITFGEHSVSTTVELPEEIGNEQSNFEMFKSMCNEKLIDVIEALDTLRK